MSCLDEPNQQAIVQCLLNDAVQNLNSPSNPFYIPQFIVNSKLDPYVVAAGNTWKIQNFTSTAIVAELPAVCTGIQLNQDPCTATQADNFIPAPNQGVDLVLSNVVVTGASNLYIDNATASGPDGFSIQINASVSTLPAPWPSIVTITGSFSLTLYCCCGDQAGTNCAQGQTPIPEIGSGTFTATIAKSSVTVYLEITDLAEGVLNIQTNSVTYTAALSDIKVTPLITSIPGKALASYQNLVNTAFTDPGTLNFILQQVNVQLNESGALQIIGTTLTKDLDSYLQANHLYPFDKSSAAAY